MKGRQVVALEGEKLALEKILQVFTNTMAFYIKNMHYKFCFCNYLFSLVKYIIGLIHILLSRSNEQF